MRFLLCCLAFASVAVSFGMAKVFVGEEDASSSQWMSLHKEESKRCQCDLYEYLFEIIGIRCSATKYKADWPAVWFTPEEICEMHPRWYPKGFTERFCEIVFRTYEVLEIPRSISEYRIDWSDIQLTPEDLFEVYTKLFPVGNAKPFSELTFRVLDWGNRGWINIKEVLPAIDNFFLLAPEEKLEQVFRFSDANGDGTITPSETTEILQTFYDMLGPWRLNPNDTPERITPKIFALFDKNNDGVLCMDEFTDIVW